MAVHAVSIEALLGLNSGRPGSPLALLRSIQQGLPVSALDKVANAFAPDDRSFKYRLVSRTTLQRRRKANGRLTAEEGGRLVRLGKVFGLAVGVYGDAEKAREFLRRPHPMLEQHSPLELALAADTGADVVVNLLGRIAFGGAV